MFITLVYYVKITSVQLPIYNYNVLSLKTYLA